MSIRIDSLLVRRSQKTIVVVPHLELDQRPTLVLGVNSAGKSTLFSVVSGKITPTRGIVQTNENVAHVEQKFRPVVGFTALEYCAYVSWLGGKNKAQAKAEAYSWLEFVDLSRAAQQKCETLSGGEQARLAIGTALNSGAHTLLLDEPSASLDPMSKERIHTVYQRIVDSERNLVVSTHDTGDLHDPFERVVVFDNGQVHFDGTRAAFINLASEEHSSPAHELSRSFMRRRQAYEA